MMFSSVSSVSNAGVITLAHRCSSLSYLSLEGSRQITDDAIRSVGKCRVLERLDVTDCPSLTDRAFDTLDFENLFEINASGTCVTGNFHAQLFNQGKVMWNDAHLRCDRCLHLSEALVDFVAGRVRLSNLSISSNNLPRDALLRLAQSCAGCHCVKINISHSVHADGTVVQAFLDHNPHMQKLSALGCGSEK